MATLPRTSGQVGALALQSGALPNSIKRKKAKPSKPKADKIEEDVSKSYIGKYLWRTLLHSPKFDMLLQNSKDALTFSSENLDGVTVVWEIKLSLKEDWYSVL